VKGGKKKRQEEYPGNNIDHGGNASKHWKSSTTFSGFSPNKPNCTMIITSWDIRGLNNKGKIEIPSRKNKKRNTPNHAVMGNKNNKGEWRRY